MPDRTSWDLGRFVQTLTYFDVIPGLSWIQNMFQPQPPPAPMFPAPNLQANLSGHRMLFDFRPSSNQGASQTENQAASLEQTWGAVDDVVMGGVSQSQVSASPEGARFAGTVSTQNSGGFASVRTRNFSPPLNLSATTTIELRVKGDGNRYKFLLRSENSWDSAAFSHSFDTVAGEWMTVSVPVATLVPTFRAKTVANLKPDLAAVRSFQLMLSKFEYDGVLNPQFTPGRFELVVESIQAN
jgi:Complex I intermediate-associated protein 30 (CIA30)